MMNHVKRPANEENLLLSPALVLKDRDPPILYSMAYLGWLIHASEPEHVV